MPSHAGFIHASLLRTIETLSRVSEDVSTLDRAATLLIEAVAAGGKVMFCGNGGSAADAQHLATELVSKFRHDRPGIPALALTTDTSALTAIANDYAYDRVFARQVEALGRPGDVLVGISTSGNSRNVVEAVRAAAARGITTIGLLGNEGGGRYDRWSTWPSSCPAPRRPTSRRPTSPSDISSATCSSSKS